MRGLRNARWVGAGLADQFVVACANAGNTVAALILLDRNRSGVMLQSLALIYVVISLNRAFVGDVLLALASRHEGERRDRLVRNGLAAAVTFAAAAAVVLLAVWALWPRGAVNLMDLVWIAPFLPVLLLQDTGRCVYLADRQPAKALRNDLVWVGVQAVAVVVMVLTGRAGAPGLFVCWGIGAAAGFSVFLLSTGYRPWQGRPLPWLAETRHLSGWFTATAVIGQFQVVAVTFLVSSQLSSRAYSGLRGAQTALLQPVQNFQTAVQGLVVPRQSRLAGDARRPGAEGERAAAALRRMTVKLALAFTALAAVMVVVVWPLASLVLVHFHKFADIAPLALPVSLQAGTYVIQVPFTAALRAMHRARLLFIQYALFTTTSLTALVVGAHLHDLKGAAWGLTIGAATGLVIMIALYGYALRFLGRPKSDGHTDREPAVAAGDRTQP